jgi:hypothetical protein
VAISDVEKMTFFLIKLNNNVSNDGLYNFGSELNITIAHMANIIAKRANLTLGVNPVIDMLGYQSILQQELRYSSNKIKKLGYKFINAIDLEIDSILHYCKINF